MIAGFVNAVQPFADESGNLTAFRFHAFNPIVDPWVFIICRKSVFRHLYRLLRCRFTRGTVKTTAQRTVSSRPPYRHAAGNPEPAAAGQPLNPKASLPAL
ncbi:hypothetical protein NHX12_008442 [Muraenolepis orangiensis]|uniref:Uncharacterized protein n=1 Tax=Muraenolepis orangiensis TaxID=630683 RepID=A0A9Q0DMW0_9TELE|nr:hypothetical protein NHX12_008442 [Muraenolepis orangiensis]